MRIEPVTIQHMMALAARGAVGAKEILDTVSYFERLVVAGPSLAGVVEEGVVAAMGMAENPLQAGVFRCWAVTDPELTSKYFIAVCHAMRRFLKENPKRRIETVVQVGNYCGMRWVENILGFERPKLMVNFNERGSAWLYELVN